MMCLLGSLLKCGLWHLTVGCVILQWAVSSYSGLWHLTVGCGILQWAVASYGGLWHLTVGCGILLWAVASYSGLWHLLLLCAGHMVRGRAALGPALSQQASVLPVLPGN